MTQKSQLQSAGDGTAVPSGYVGERKISSASTNITLSTSVSDIGLSFTLEPGEWIVGYRASVYLNNPTGSSATNSVNLIITDGNNVAISRSGSDISIQNQPASNATSPIIPVQCEVPLTVTANQTVKLRGFRANVSANTSLLHDDIYRITMLYARRIA